MSTQDFFTSRRNYNDGTSRIGDLGRLWYDAETNTIRVGDGSTPGGKIVSAATFLADSSVGHTLYFQSTPSDIPFYETLTVLPVVNVLDDESISIQESDGEVYIDQYITAPDEFNAPSIPPGEWKFRFWSYVSRIAQISQLRFKVLLRHVDTSETLLFTVDSSDIDALISTEIETIYTTTEPYILLTTDRLVIRVYAVTSASSHVTIHWVHDDGNASHVHTPIPISGGGGVATSGYSGYSGRDGAATGSGYSGAVGASGYSGAAFIGSSGYSGSLGYSGYSGSLGYSGYSGISGGPASWTVITGNTAAISKSQYIANTAGGSFWLILPASPSLGDVIVVNDGADLVVNPLYIDSNGKTIDGVSDNLVIDVKNILVQFLYDGLQWQVAATAGPRGISGYSGYSGIPQIENTWVPNVSSTVGSISSSTSSGRYTKIGNTYFIYLDINVISNGTGSGQINATLPSTATGPGVITGIQGTSGNTLVGNISTNSNLVVITNYDSSYPASDNSLLKLSGFFI